ncbi:hypothetical protein ACIF83_41085 [Streptomyces sp. NPDC085866]|uniref:hypothetical protein n=1 Tax=Streptomyces sp. NPDC085866 TaxID=3365736 RepID=UPI0037D18441
MWHTFTLAIIGACSVAGLVMTQLVRFFKQLPELIRATPRDHDGCQAGDNRRAG